jgi:hypothetical protein
MQWLVAAILVTSLIDTDKCLSTVAWYLKWNESIGNQCLWPAHCVAFFYDEMMARRLN